MRSMLSAPLLVLLMAGAAAAADVADPGTPIVAPAGDSSPVYIWSGPYAGAFVGYNSSSFDADGAADFDGEGFVGGVYAGANAQSGDFVYGVEADIGKSSVDADGSAAGEPLFVDTNAFGSLRGRVGVVVDPFLVFATGGLAVSEQELSFEGVSDTQTNFGATVGAGIEGRITDTITSRVEYRYSNFGEETYDLGDTSISSGFDEHSVRAGVALQF